VNCKRTPHGNVPSEKMSHASVVYDFQAKGSEELSVYRGDVVSIIKQYMDGWTFCSINERTGMVPTAYLEMMPQHGSSSESTTDSSFVNSKDTVLIRQFNEDDTQSVASFQSEDDSISSDLPQKKKQPLLKRLGSFFGKRTDDNKSFRIVHSNQKTPQNTSSASLKSIASFTRVESLVDEDNRGTVKMNAKHVQIFPTTLVNDFKKRAEANFTSSSIAEKESNGFSPFMSMKRKWKRKRYSLSLDEANYRLINLIQCHARRNRMLNYLKQEDDFKKAKRRLDLIKETIETERTYVGLLKVFIEVFYYPIINNHGHGKGILKDPSVLFSNIEQIYQINSTLLSDWEREYIKYPFVQVGKAFSQISPFLKAYTIYINNFDKAQDTFEKLREKDKRFKEYLMECYRNKATKGHQLGGFLILPVQRLPRFRLLLEEILKNTPTSHVEYNMLKQCLKEIESLNSYVNDEKRRVEQNQVVFEVQRLIQKQYNSFVQPNRKFIRRGTMKVGYTVCYTEQQLEMNPKKSGRLDILSQSMSNFEGKFDIYLFTDIMVLIEHDKTKQNIIQDDQVHFIFMQFVDCRDFIKYSDKKKKLTFIDSPETLLANHNKMRGSLQFNEGIFSRIEEEDFTFTLEVLFKGLKQEFVFQTSNVNEKSSWMKSIKDCLEEISKSNSSKGIKGDIYTIGKERASLNRIAKTKLEEHQKMEKANLLKVSYLTQLDHHLQKKKKQLAKLQKEIGIYELDREQVLHDVENLQEKKGKIREDLKFYYSSIQERDVVCMKLLNEEDSFKLVFDDVPSIDYHSIHSYSSQRSHNSLTQQPVTAEENSDNPHVIKKPRSMSGSILKTSVAAHPSSDQDPGKKKVRVMLKTSLNK